MTPPTHWSIEQKLQSLKIHLSNIVIYRRYVVLTALAVCALGWTAVNTMPNVYETKTKVYADTSSILKPLLSGLAVQEDTQQEIQIISRTLLSRDNLEDILSRSGLSLNVKTPEQNEMALQRLKDSIQIEGSVRTNVYDISYSHPNANVAQSVVELTLKKFVDASAGRTRNDTATASEFLSQQIETYRRRLSRSEQELAEFKRKNQEHLPNQGNSYYNVLAQVKRDIDQVSLTLQEKTAELSGFRARVAGSAGAYKTPNQMQVATDVDGRLDALTQELEQLRLRYTEKHPYIQEIQQRIDIIKEQQTEKRQSSLEQVSTGVVAFSSDQNNEALRQVALKISSLEAERDSLQIRKDALERKQYELQQQLTVIPNIEAQLTELQRNYQNDSEYYQKLIARRDSAELSRSADEKTQDVKFNILEEPRKALMPVGPPRIAMYIAVLLLGWTIGLVVAFGRSQISSRVVSPEHLALLVGEERVISQLPHHSEHEILKVRRRGTIYIIAIALGLLCTCAILIAHELLYGISLLQRFAF